jgi:hypothetical protein
MHAYYEFDECLLLEIEMHDLQTSYNYTVEIFGTPADIRLRWLRAERLLARAGFVCGWRNGAAYKGSIDHLVLVKEAADRCWLQRAADLVP